LDSTPRQSAMGKARRKWRTEAMKPRRFLLYFHRYGQADWVVKVPGAPARLTRHFEFVGTFKPGQVGEQIRKHQPRAVIAGKAVVRYSRDCTLIIGEAA